MQPREIIVNQVRAALERDARIDPANFPVDILVDGNALTLSGEVPSIASKRVAVSAVSDLDGVGKTVDRLRLASAIDIGDGAIRDAACDSLTRDVDFLNCSLRAKNSGRMEVLRVASGDSCGEIDVTVTDGVITLDGHVISLSHKRLAGVLAWWARGCRDVVNQLEVRPPEDDNDEEVIEALRLVLETDPLVPATQIAIDSRNFVVTLRGVVATEEERKRAELDAWYLHGIKRVHNELEVRPTS